MLIARGGAFAAVTAVVAAIAIPAAAEAATGIVFGASSYTSSMTLVSPIQSYQASSVTAYNGGYIMGTAGGAGRPLYQYNSSGTYTGTLAGGGLDDRSLFTDTSGTLYARQYADNRILKWNGTSFVTQVTLQGTLGTQAGVYLNSAGTGYIGLDNNTLRTWNLDGTVSNTIPVSLSGINVGILGNYLLMFSSGTLSAYDMNSWTLADQTTLVGATDSFFQSYSNGYFFAADPANSTRMMAYQVGPASSASAVPEPASWVMMIGGFGMVGAGMRRRRLAAA